MIRKFFYCFFLLSIIALKHNAAFAQCCTNDFVVKKLIRSGISVGYQINFYDAAGFNRYIDIYNSKFASSMITKMEKFGFGSGFIAGANLAQFQIDEFLIGVKASFYQSREKHSAKRTLVSGGDIEETYDLSITTFGLGITTTAIVSKRFELKFIDALLTWNSAKLINTYTDPFSNVSKELTSPRRKLGFNIGAGVIFYPLPSLLALEALGGYAFLALNKMQFDDGDLLAETPNGGPAMDNFIIAGGYFAVLQLHLSLNFK